MPEAEGRMPESVEYRCMTTARDYLKANYVFKLGDIWFWMMFVAISVVCVYGGYSKGMLLLDDGYAFKHMLRLIIFVGLYLGWLWVAFWLPERNFRDLPYVDVEFDMTVDESGIFGRGAQMNYGFYWGAYTKAVEKQDFFMLIQARRGYQPFPKRCMAGEDEKRIRELIRAHIPDTRLLN